MSRVRALVSLLVALGCLPVAWAAGPMLTLATNVSDDLAQVAGDALPGTTIRVIVRLEPGASMRFQLRTNPLTTIRVNSRGFRGGAWRSGR